MSAYHQILIASVGGQPQIVTLTLDLLLRQHISIAEVIVLHPALPDARLQHTLGCLKREFAEQRYTCDGQSYACALQLVSLRQDDQPLPDITDTLGAHAARDVMHQLVRHLKQQQCHIHLSASGGRRILSLMAISAALLHFDDLDHIWHIYTPPEIRAQVSEGAQMHVPPDAGVRLIEVPFVPWGAYLPHLAHLNGSAQAVQRAQTAFLDTQERAKCEDVVRQATRAQLNVLRHFSQGFTPSQIAERLGISVRTVYSHTSELLSLAHNAWYIPLDERLDYNFLRQKFAQHFNGTS